MVDKEKVERVLLRLKEIVQSVSEEEYPKAMMAEEYNDIVEELENLMEKDFKEHKIPPNLFWKNSLGLRLVTRSAVAKMKQFHAYITNTKN